MTTIRKTIAASLAALTLATALAASVGSAEAAGRAQRDRNWNGGAVAAGVVGAIALGAIAASAAKSRPAPAPVYEDCGWEREPVYNRYGEFVGWRNVPGC